MFRSFITNLVLQACFTVTLVLGMNSRLDHGRELFLLNLASACMFASAVYTLLRKRFWRMEKRLHDIAPPVFVFGVIVAYVALVRLMIEDPSDQELMLGSTTFCLMTGLAGLTWYVQKWRSLPTLLWMVSHGVSLSALTRFQNWLLGAVALYGICLTAVCLVVLIVFLIGFLRNDHGASPQYAKSSPEWDDSISARGYGSSHV